MIHRAMLSMMKSVLQISNHAAVTKQCYNGTAVAITACMTIWGHLWLQTRRNAVPVGTAALRSVEMTMIIKIFIHWSRVVTCVAWRTSDNNAVNHAEMLTNLLFCKQFCMYSYMNTRIS